MKKLILLIATLISFQVFSEDKIQFEIQKSFNLYDIYGSNGNELEESFKINRPKELMEKNFDASTTWDYSLSYSTKTCEILDFSLSIDYKLPLIHTSKMDKKLKKEAVNYMSKLYSHEKIHCAIVVEKMHEIYMTLKDGQRSGCKGKKKEVDKLKKQINDINDDFDKISNHGNLDVKFHDEYYLDACKISI